MSSVFTDTVIYDTNEGKTEPQPGGVAGILRVEQFKLAKKLLKLVLLQ